MKTAIRFALLLGLVVIAGLLNGCASIDQALFRTEILPGVDSNAQYLKQSVMAVPYNGTIAAPASAAVCLPAGLPVIETGEKGKNGQNVYAVEGSLIGGWGKTFADPLPVDCRDGKTPVWGGESISYLPTQKPQLTAVAGDTASLVKNEADFKSGFAANDITLASFKDNKTDKGICLPRGTRMSVWVDSTDMARTIVEPVDSSTKQCDGSPLPTQDADTTYYAPTVGVARTLTSWQFASGALAVPFKYYVGGDRGFGGSSAVGPYIGIRARWSSSGLEWTGALFGGYTTVPVPLSAGDGTGAHSTSVSGFTGGLAFLTSLGDNTKSQAGIVFGWDYVSDNVKWKNNHKLWMALQFGYAFF